MTGNTSNTLLTDLYQLTMAESYFRQNMNQPATFSLFVRRLPVHRGYLVSAGLADTVEFLTSMRFSGEDISFLESTRRFSGDFLDYLSKFRFSGDVWAIPEGKIYFADEPMIEVTAPLIESQIVETFILNQMSFQSLIASKAARCVSVSGERNCIDFALRRTHGTDAGMKVARSSYLSGFESTSNVLAGKEYGIPLAGTMAHSYIASFPTELDAFRAYALSYPDSCVLLIDTYDTIDGARNAAVIGREMEAQGHHLRAVRLDSGDLIGLSYQVREILDEANLRPVRIIASGSLDEFEVEKIAVDGAPIDGLGIGTKMGVSGDAPWLDTVYKLVMYDERPILKLSEGKGTLAGEKQIFRTMDIHGKFGGDVIGMRGELPGEGEDLLLEQIMANGVLTGPLPTLGESRERFKTELAKLPDPCKLLTSPTAYPVTLSERLTNLQEQILRNIREVSFPRGSNLTEN